MADATFQACVSAIRARVEILPWWRGKNSPAAARAGLVTMAHAIDALARRYLEPLDWPGHEVSQHIRDLWLVDWYTGYCAAVLELAEAAQAASRSGTLKLRSAKTRALLADGLSGWPGADLRAQAQSAKLFYESAQWEPLDAQWPDELPMPPGCVSPEDADAWAASAGVAQTGALLALLGIATDDEQAATAGPLNESTEPAPAGGANAAVDGPPPLTSPQIADAFNGIDDLSALQWRARLGEPPKWLEVERTRASIGTAPKPSTWWPLELARILTKRGVAYECLNRKFVNERALKPWLPKWQAERRECNGLEQ